MRLLRDNGVRRFNRHVFQRPDPLTLPFAHIVPNGYNPMYTLSWRSIVDCRPGEQTFKEALMTISFDIPPNVEIRFAEGGRDINLAAKEAALVELYRQEKISHGELAQALDLSRLEVDAVLKRHGVTEDLITAEELDAQVTRLNELLS